MSLPKEGSRDVDDGIIVSMVPDICLTPAGGGMVPVPYTIWCRQADAANLANSVRQTDDRSHAVASIVVRCYGDEPGTGGGIHSGTTGAECTPKTWSQTVRAEGRNMVRHDDEWWMNNRNTFGRLIYLKDICCYPDVEMTTVTPQIKPPYQSIQSNYSLVPQAMQQAQAGVSPMVGGEGPIGAAAAGAPLLGNSAYAFGQGVNKALPAQGDTWQDYLSRPINNTAAALGYKKIKAGTKAYWDWVRVSKPQEGCGWCRTISGRYIPAGTWGYLGPHNTVDPNRVEHGVQGPHYNLFMAHQIPPKDCRCQWQKQSFVVSPADIPFPSTRFEPFANAPPP